MNKSLVIIGMTLLLTGAIMIPTSQIPQISAQKNYQQLKRIDNVDTQNISWRTWLEAGKEHHIELKNDGGTVIEIAPWNLLIKMRLATKRIVILLTVVAKA
jgi:hypothetical protein